MIRLVVFLSALTIAGCARADRPASEGSSEPAAEPAVPTIAVEPTSSSDERPVVLFIGNSLTAGLGVDETEAFPALVQGEVDAADLEFRVINAGVSGETSAGGLSRIDFLLEQDPAVVVIGLGGNDALRGVPPDRTRLNLQQMIDRARSRNPDMPVVLLGMLAPPNMGEAYTSSFAAVFPLLAAQNQAVLVPFLLDRVAADPALNQADGIHPNAAGHEIMAATVWRHLQPVLSELYRDTEIGGSG